MRPKISVIMPNYNTPIEMLERAVNSILEQTYRNFEFIIVDDCSTDESYDYLKTLDDSRIKLIRNDHNMGVTKTLNIAMTYANGEYIARMDSDDISLPNRLERQLAFMEVNPQVVVCGTYAREIGDKNRIRHREIPSQNIYQCGVLFGNIYGLIHPTAFFRGVVLKENNITYDENITTAQDYAMWAKCCRYGEVANIDEELFLYRIHENQISSKKRETQVKCTIYTLKNELSKIIPNITDREVEQHYQYCISYEVNSGMKKWLKRIIVANKEMKYVDPSSLTNFVESFWKSKINVASRNIHTPNQLIRLCLQCTVLEWPIIFKNILVRVYSKIKK